MKLCLVGLRQLRVLPSGQSLPPSQSMLPAVQLFVPAAKPIGTLQGRLLLLRDDAEL